MRSPDYSDSPYVSPAQEQKWQVFEALRESLLTLIDEKRSNALEGLLDKRRSSDSKRRALEAFFDFRMDLNKCIIFTSDQRAFSAVDLVRFAYEIYEDHSFAYNDADLVIDTLDFFPQSLTIDDVVLAYHYYRLAKDDESLSTLVRIIGYYSQYALEMDGLRSEVTIPNEDLIHSESISLMHSILSFVDDLLSEYQSQVGSYASQFELCKDEKLSLSSRIDKDAAQSMAKRTAMDIRISSLMDFFKHFDTYSSKYESGLSLLLYKMYSAYEAEGGVKQNGAKEPTLPSFAYLLNCAMENYLQDKRQNPIDKDIYDFLDGLQKNNYHIVFDGICQLTKDDREEADKNNKEVDTHRAYDSFRRNIRFLFIVKMVTRIIPEFKSKEKRLAKICSQLCEIYTDEYAEWAINNEETLDTEAMSQFESKANEQKSKLFESFLGMYKLGTIEEIMAKRQEMLDHAREISPEDFDYIDECSNKLLDLIIQSHELDFSAVEESVKSSLELQNTRLLSDEVIHTLSTAELLFSKYANEKFANAGFDFSSISALYYQAFEKAYNELIWEKYARHLNTMIIGEQKYTDILQDSFRQDIKESDPGYGYLPQKKQDRMVYTHGDKTARWTRVKETCMYGPFLLFIDGQKYKMSEIPHFYDWLAQVIGFTHTTEMLNNNGFMEELTHFREEMNTAWKNRNIASHGGVIINVEQCKTDRQIVLSNIQDVRMLHLGLIHRLINLFAYTI